MDNHFSINNSGKAKLINNTSTNKVFIPTELIDSVNKIIQGSIKNNENPLDKEKLDKILEITIKPEFQKGINKGILTVDKGSLVIRNKKTGQIVGKGKLEEKIKLTKGSSSLTSITRNIASISGQLQMAEISQKLDTINEKIDLLGEFLWREKTSELQGLKSVIEEAVESLPNKHAIKRINDSIIELNILSNFFKDTIEDILSLQIEYKLSDNFLEGFKVWEWKRENRKEYNTKYNNEIHSFMNEYGFLLELYFQTLGLLGTCYQITNEYHHASKYFKKVENEITYYSKELTNRLIYLLDIQEVNIDNNVPLQSIIEKVENRKLPDILLQEIHNNDNKLKEAKDMHEKFISQFENIQLTYEVDSKFLERGISHE